MRAKVQFPEDVFRGAGDLAAPNDPILVRLFGYWDGKRGDRLMPRRADIDPVEMRGLVTNVMLYDVVTPGSVYRIRLVGQAIVDFVGVNTTGQLAQHTMPPDAAQRIIEILTSVTTKRAPRFRAGHAYWHKDKSYRKFEGCFLPLSADGEAVDMILSGVVFKTE